MLKSDIAMIADDGFVQAVATRVKHRVRYRRIIIGSSAFAGGLIGFMPLKQLGMEIARRIDAFTVDWQSVATLSFDWSNLGSLNFDWQSIANLPAQTQWLIIGAAMALLTPVVTRLLDR